MSTQKKKRHLCVHPGVRTQQSRAADGRRNPPLGQVRSPSDVRRELGDRIVVPASWAEVASGARALC